MVTLVDEEGKEERFFIVDVVEVADNKYAVLLPKDAHDKDAHDIGCEELEDGDKGEPAGNGEDIENAFILKVETDENGEEILVDIEDDDEYDRVLDALDEMSDEGEGDSE